ncbi:MAG: prepilin-type N-terminal cleavage/methylation domain-containing protein [Pyrinomonadaceae bacterium]|nr:prepilin-type N-terminal cleavage/methylation domain-containing protein [Pyrinomonadaceae bacterium]
MVLPPANLKSEHGFSLVELLVVITIIAVVAGLAMMQRGNANEQFQRQNAARELKTAFERARFDSVKRRAIISTDTTDPNPDKRARVIIDTAGFTLVTDVNQNGDVADAGDSVTTPFPPNIAVTPRTGLSLPLTVSFNRRGEPDVADLQLLVCNGTCGSGTGTSADANVLLVTATGTVEMLPGGSAINPYPTPVVTVVPGGTAIRSETYIEP